MPDFFETPEDMTLGEDIRALLTSVVNELNQIHKELSKSIA